MQNALEEIKNSQETEATIVLSANIGSDVKFVGVADKSITVKSTEGQKYALTLGSELVGDITLDNVKASAGTLYCSGHRTIFTENCEFTISGTLYGGGNKKTVASVYVKINGTGKINTADLENVVIGGSYKGSVEGDIYVELAGNISYGNEEGGNYLAATNKATAYGGDKPSGGPLYVGGNVTLILDSPAKDTKPQNVIGAYNSHVKGNVTVQVKSGYFNGINGMREDADQSIVDGNIHIIGGDPAYEGSDRICRVGHNWDITGAGEQINNSGLFQVKGNVIIDTYENVWGWDKNGTPDYDPPGIVGADSAVVGGDVTINVHGSHLEDITGVDESMVSGSLVKGNVIINATNAELRDKDNTSYIYPISDGTIEKNATINMDGGQVSQINCSVGTTKGNTTVNITGQPKFTLLTDGVWGQRVTENSAGDKSVLNLDKASTSIPIVGYFKTVNVINDSDVILGNENKNAFGTVYDVNINTNAKLTTNKQAYAKGALNMDHGTWVANGYLYITSATNTSNSKIVMNDYAAFGYGYKDDNPHDKIAVTSSDDTYIFNEHAFINRIYGNAEIANSTWSVFVPTSIYGNYNAASSKLNLFAFTGDENYPDETIPLEILGTATGKTAVTLVDKKDTSKEGEPIVGQNYINALKVSENTFELANENAKTNGLYFKKLADANTEDKSDYDMWQVAPKDEYQVLYSFESGTSGKTLPSEVTSLLPEDSNKYSEGDTINAIQPGETKVAVTDGAWTFKGYDADSKIASETTADEDRNIKFTGTWEFELNSYSVNYSFKSTNEDEELPTEIKDQLPTAGSIKHGSTVTAPDTTFDDVEVADGVWTFKGWTPDQYENVTENVEFVGTWEFKRNASMINRVPTINASDKTLTVGDEFDPLKDVTATDEEDGDIPLTIENVIENGVNTSEAGVYEVTYKVTDSQGASFIKTIYVTVNPKMEGLNQIPTIDARDKTITVGDEFDPLKDVTATDKEDGDLTSVIAVLKNEVNTTKAGTYEVTYKVTDRQGASSVKTIKVTVKAKDTPVVPSEPNKPNDLNKPVVPNVSVNDKTPETGDSTNMTLWILLVMVSGISVLGVYRRKRQINQHKR